MEVATITGLFNTLGTAGIFLYACWYLMRRMEEQSNERAKEAREREDRLVKSLAETDQYMRTTWTAVVERNAGVVERNTEAMHEMAQAMEGLACRELRKEDITHVINERRFKKGEVR